MMNTQRIITRGSNVGQLLRVIVKGLVVIVYEAIFTTRPADKVKAAILA
jgi:hypothetical protein